MSSAAAASAHSQRTSSELSDSSPMLSPRQRKSSQSASSTRGSGGESSFLSAPPMSPSSPRPPKSPKTPRPPMSPRSPMPLKSPRTPRPPKSPRTPRSPKSPKSPKSPRSERSSNKSNSRRLKHQSSRTSEGLHDSEYGGGTDASSKGGSSRRSRRSATPHRESYMQRSFRILEEPRGQRRFQATVIFKEYCLHYDKDRMKVDQLKPYVARVFNTKESSLDEAPLKLVLEEALKKSKDEPEGILNMNAVVSAVIKYGDYAKHCKEIEKLFHDVDWSKDGKLQREELRELIQIYESNQIRSTDFVKNVLLFVTEDDINHILHVADKNHDGDIDLGEVVLAIDIWEELARSKLADFDKLHCQKCRCTIS